MITSAAKIALSVAIASLCGQPATAQDTLSAKLVAQQKWTMSAPLNKAQPDCVETWTVRVDATMTIQSGAERVEKKWRVADDDGSQSLYLRRMSSTGGLDCLKYDNAPFDEPQPEDADPLWVLAFNGNDELLLCNPLYAKTKHDGKQSRMYGDNCWGRLVPANLSDDD